jgi:beta-galactosidase
MNCELFWIVFKKFSGGVSDRAIVLIDNKSVATVEGSKDYNFNTNETQFPSTGNEPTLDIIVENMGRANIGNDMNSARKGLNGDVSADDKLLSNYKIYPLEFKQKFVEDLKAEKGRALETVNSPALFRAELDIKDKPRDTFLKLDKWTKGSVFVNGFNVGRYYNRGPQHTLYIPAPLLKTGKNDIFIFELHSATNTIEFVDKPILG